MDFYRQSNLAIIFPYSLATYEWLDIQQKIQTEETQTPLQHKTLLSIPLNFIQQAFMKSHYVQRAVLTPTPLKLAH